MPTRKPPVRSYDPVETRTALVRAALELFSEKGFRATPMAEVAERAGVTKGAFYHHFASKDELLAEIHDEFVSVELTLQADAMNRFDDVEELLEQLVFDFAMVTLTYQAQVRIFFQELRELAGERRSLALEKRESALNTFRDVIQRGVESGVFDKTLDADIAARGVVGMCAYAYQWYRPDSRLSAEAIARQFTVMAISSLKLAAWPERELVFATPMD